MIALSLVEGFSKEAKKKTKDSVWFGKHEHSSKWNPPEDYDAPQFTGLMDIVTEGPKLLSPYHQYMGGRSGSQKWSDGFLQKTIGTIKPHKLDKPHSRALLDEARARGLKVRKDAPKPVGAPEAPPSSMAPMLAGAGLGLGSYGLAKATMGWGHDPEKMKGGETLHRLLRSKGVGTRHGEGAYFSPSEKMIETVRGQHPAVLLHEAGHALKGGLGTKILRKTYGPAKLWSAAAMPAAFTYGMNVAADPSFAKDKKEKKRRLKRAERLMYASTLPYAPVLAEEARASINAVRLSNRLQGRRAAAETGLRLAPAFGTYMAGAAPSVLGGLYLRRLRKKMDKK